MASARLARHLSPIILSSGKPRLLAFVLAVMLSISTLSCDDGQKTSLPASQSNDNQPDSPTTDNPPVDNPCIDNPPTPPSPMNILLITADDLGMHVGAYGETLIQTPNIDGLAAAGERFAVAYVAQPSCSPSRASLFTGMYAHSHGQYGLVDTGLALHEELRNATIPNLLKQAGYRTGLIGKLHVNPDSSFQFDYRSAINTRMVRDVARKVDDFIVSAGNQPFFLMVNYKDPHVNGQFAFDVQVGGLPESPMQPSSAIIFAWQQTDSLAHQTRTAGYYSSVQRLDVGIGMLMETLSHHGLLANTLVIFTSDNGPPFSRAKTSLYENGIRTPLIVLWPGVTTPGEVNRTMVSTVDILPTILDAAGQPIPSHVQGVSLKGALWSPECHGRKYLVAEHHFHMKHPFIPQRAIRNDRFKLIHNLRAGSVTRALYVDSCMAYQISRQPEYDGTPVRTAFDIFADPPEFELYDLVDDPIEFHNLAADPQYQDVLNELKAALLTWRLDTNDSFLDQAVMDYYINFSLSQ
jgi:N-sulfoglucosamine sulfohydrolase